MTTAFLAPAPVALAFQRSGLPERERPAFEAGWQAYTAPRAQWAPEAPAGTTAPAVERGWEAAMWTYGGQ